MPKQLVQASFFWKNDQPGGLGFTFGPPSFFPEELQQMFASDIVKQYFIDSDMALGTDIVQAYLSQLEAWRSFETVRQSNEYNMWSPHAADAAGLNRDEHLLCINHYEALKKASEAEQAA